MIFLKQYIANIIPQGLWPTAKRKKETRYIFEVFGNDKNSNDKHLFDKRQTYAPLHAVPQHLSRGSLYPHESRKTHTPIKN